MTGCTKIHNDSQDCAIRVAVNTNDNETQICITCHERLLSTYQINLTNITTIFIEISHIRYPIRQEQTNLELVKNHVDMTC